MNTDTDFFLQTYGQAANEVRRGLSDLNQKVATAFPKDDPLKTKTLSFIQEGGKRFRPALSLAVAKFLGNDYVWPHLALETFHKYILAHDDVIDLDDKRYGQPTVHASMAKLCPAITETAHFGHSLAIVAGDLIEATTHRIILSANISATQKVRLCELLAQAMDEVGWGWYDQFLMDYLPLNSPKLSFERIETSIIWVTGKYSLKLPLLYGFVLANKKPPKGLETFADTAGALFQTGDDLLGLFGNPSETGKSNYGDIAQGKKTLPMWLAYQRASSKDKHTLNQLVGKKDLSKTDAETVRQIIVNSGALDESKKLMARYLNTCIRQIENLKVNDNIKQFLRGFVYFLETRDR